MYYISCKIYHFFSEFSPFLLFKKKKITEDLSIMSTHRIRNKRRLLSGTATLPKIETRQGKMNGGKDDPRKGEILLIRRSKRRSWVSLIRQGHWADTDPRGKTGEKGVAKPRAPTGTGWCRPPFVSVGGCACSDNVSAHVNLRSLQSEKIPSALLPLLHFLLFGE